MRHYRIAVLPGDGIGSEDITESVQTLEALKLHDAAQDGLACPNVLPGGFHLCHTLPVPQR